MSTEITGTSSRAQWIVSSLRIQAKGFHSEWKNHTENDDRCHSCCKKNGTYNGSYPTAATALGHNKSTWPSRIERDVFYIASFQKQTACLRRFFSSSSIARSRNRSRHFGRGFISNNGPRISFFGKMEFLLVLNIERSCSDVGEILSN